MPVATKRPVKPDDFLVNKTFGHYKGIKEDMQRVDPSLLSCSQIYESECAKLGLRPNQDVMNQLPKVPGKYNMQQLNVGCSYIGDKGLVALLPVIEVNQNLRRLKLCDNGLKNDSVLKLLKIIKAVGNVVSLDLSSNKHLSLEVGTMCLQLAKGNPNVTHLCLNKTGVSKQLQDSIEKALRSNRQRLGMQNKGLYEMRKRIDKRQFLEIKEVFDELDVDKSGVVSIKELHELASSKAAQGYKALEFMSNANIFDRIDGNNDGELTILEFYHASFPGHTREEILYCIDCFSEFEYPDYDPPPELSPQQVAEIAEIFRAYDKSGDGKLTLSELRQGLSKSAFCVDVEGYFRDHDASGDGTLDLKEYTELMKQYYIG